MTTIENTELLHLAESWRSKATRIQNNYGPTAPPGAETPG